MGIKGLPILIEKVANSAVKTCNFDELKGIKVAVDASLIIHQTVIALRSTGRDMKNSRGELTSHLHGLFYKILTFLQNEMVPVFVFDGKSPEIKNKTLTKRKDRKEKAKEKLDEINDSEDEEYIKNFKQTFSPTRENIKEAMIMLDLMGIPYILAPEEADVVCAWLSIKKDSSGKKYVKGVCSDDSDMLPLGAPYLFKNMLKFMNKKKMIKVINLKKTLKKMNFTQDQFIDLCVMLGTDYCNNIKGYGAMRSYRLLKKYDNLENVLEYVSENQKQTSDTKKNTKCMLQAKEYFTNAVSELDKRKFRIKKSQYTLRNYQHDELLDFMCGKHNFDYERIIGGIRRLKQYYTIMEVTKPNNKIYHTISQNKIYRSIYEDIELESESEEERPSKKTTNMAKVKNNLIRKKG